MRGMPEIADRKLCFELFCHHDPEPKPWAYAKGLRRGRIPSFFYNRNEFLRFAQDNASGDWTRSEWKKGRRPFGFASGWQVKKVKGKKRVIGKKRTDKKCVARKRVTGKKGWQKRGHPELLILSFWASAKNLLLLSSLRFAKDSTSGH